MVRETIYFSTVLVVLTMLVASADAQTKGDSILGRWTDEDRTRVLEFQKVGDYYEAIIKDAPDKTLIGQKRIVDLKYSGGAYNGLVYLPNRGRTLRCKLTIDSEGHLRLTAKSGFMSQSQTWSRVR